MKLMYDFFRSNLVDTQRERYMFLAIMVIASLLYSLLIFGCASTASKKEIDLVWPLPPDEPRISYVDTIRSTMDMNIKTSIADSIFGEEKVYAFNKPYGVSVDRQGSIYITDIGKVVILDINNGSFGFVGNTPGVGQLKVPIGIAVSDDGRLFVSDVALNKVYIYQNRKFLTALGGEGVFDNPSGLAIDEVRRLLYVADAQKHSIFIYSLDTYSPVGVIGQRGVGPAEFNYPTNIALDQEGRLYIVDAGNFRVQVLTPAGEYIKSFGTLGDTPGSFARPKGIAIDSEGHIYVVDAAFQNFQIFDFDGNILLFVGEAGTGPGQFALPAGMTIDHEDRIYVINQMPGLLQIFQYLGEGNDNVTEEEVKTEEEVNSKDHTDKE